MPFSMKQPIKTNRINIRGRAPSTYKNFKISTSDILDTLFVFAIEQTLRGAFTAAQGTTNKNKVQNEEYNLKNAEPFAAYSLQQVVSSTTSMAFEKERNYKRNISKQESKTCRVQIQIPIIGS